MSAYLSEHLALIVFLAACTAATVLPRFLPLFCFRGNIPDWLRDWLDFVPAAVMAALVIPDLVFKDGALNLHPIDNIFLLAGILSMVFAVISKNFFGTILFAMAAVAGLRYLGLG